VLGLVAPQFGLTGEGDITGEAGGGSLRLTDLLVALCVLSMTVGNLAALAQRDLKRLLAYSTVAHAGYMMIGLLAFSQTGMAAVAFYALTYVPMAFCAFLVVCALGRNGDNPTLDSIAGLHRRAPLLAALLLIGMFGLAGIPPTPGFAGKWFLFAAALERDMFWLVLVAAINATISLYYYLQVVKAAYLSPAPAHDDAHDDAHDAAHDKDVDAAGSKDGDTFTLGSPAYVLGAALAIALVAVLGFYPGPLWDMALEAARLTLGR
ncbi:MAG: proton-conducting transporter membrane subunit, partial [Myxococcota bacterium]